MNGTTHLPAESDAVPRISVVLPLFNERAVLRQLYDDVNRSLRGSGHTLEVIFVNDGSNDGSDVILDQLAAHDPHVRVLHLSRNFGHQAAVQAGLSHARGDAVIVMDSDLQDDPSCLPELIRQWELGHDVVYAVRTKRKEWLGKRVLFFAFYRLLNAVSKTPVPNDAGNFGLISRSVVDQLVKLGEYDRFYAGLRQWVGFKQVGIPVERAARHDGTPRVSVWGLFRLAKTALFSFSSAPLAMFYGIAALALVVFGLVSAYSLLGMLYASWVVPAWASSVMTGSLLGAVNALGVAVLGEYIVRIYDQVRGRPSFIVARQLNCPRGSSSLESEWPAAVEETLVEDALQLQTDVRDAFSVVTLPVETH